MTTSEHTAAGVRLERLRRRWREMQPSEALRTQAEAFLTSYPLKAADALQLAAAYIWCLGTPQSRLFISGDSQLLQAARQVGFHTVTA